MCGFTGYFYTDSRTEANNQAIRQMLAMQQHRGPDDSGIVGINTTTQRAFLADIHRDETFEQACDLIFGFNRLSILDLSPMGHQPMLSTDKQVVLMMNGEVYNAFDFKPELASKGYVFKSSSDTEVVLYLYQEYGMERMIQLLNGMFALAIYDFKLDTLFLARDRFGIKPLYLLEEQGRIAFASEMKSFKALPDFKFEADFTQLDEFLLFRNVINNTLFKNIRNCTPGTYLSICQKQVKTHVFYDIDKEGENPINAAQAKTQLESALKKSVASQMISDVKLGSQLSGGVDSSLVSYYAAKSLEQGNFETISITFKDPKFTEKAYIDQVASALSLASHQYEMHADYYFQVLEKAIWHFEQPLNHPNTIGIYLLSQQAKKHVTVLLSGEGADESLAGYSRFVRAVQSPFWSKTFLSLIKRNKDNLFEFLGYFTSKSKRLVMETAFGSPKNAQALRSDFSLKKAIASRTHLYQKLKGDTTLKQRKYELLTYLPDLLMRQDKMSMAHSIENRVPFLDNEMVSTSLNLTANSLIVKHRGKIQAKAVLKEICADKFGAAFAYREKMGFGIPLRTFMSSEGFQHRWKNQIAPAIQKRGLFEVKALNRWTNNINKATPEQLDAIWLMLGFELWAQQYLDA